jgi:hypothetical protein
MDHLDDPDTDAPPDAARKMMVLHQVAAYRELCRRVARSGTHSLIFGAVMLALWYAQFGQGRANNALKLFSLLYLTVAVLEFAVGLMNLFDGVVLMVFGASTLARQYMLMQGMAPGRPSTFFAVFGALWLWQGFNHVRGYNSLRRAFVERPTAAHMRWFEELLREIRSSDPEADPQALDLPSKPRIRGKLLGDLALFLVGGPDQLVIAHRDDVSIIPEEADEDDPDRLPFAGLYAEGQELGRFRLDPENWRNYTSWKAEGGEPPVVRPVRKS